MRAIYILIIILYCISLFYILLYSFVQLHLLIKYRKLRNQYKALPPLATDDPDLPFVTVQLPIYNELYVIERLIDSVAAFDYPLEKLQIQVLDDSTDETIEITRKKVEAVAAQGVNIVHVRRSDRKGFKAGALEHGLQSATGSLIAIFDADFLPTRDFLLKTVRYFQDEEIGMVQTRWGHINENYSVLTKALAFQLNTHFTIEQGARSQAGYFMNFNGTAGVWRKSAIADGGGWHDDTLTEDLDLSYRVQLKGWKFTFLEDVVAPAELPAVMSAIKSQQYRWTKGGAETARKHLVNVWKSKNSFERKIHAIAHLLNTSIFIFVLLTAVLSVPALWVKSHVPEFKIYFDLGGLFFIAFVILMFFYIFSLHVRPGTKADKFKYFVKMFPTFICLSMGLGLHNTIAVVRGFMGQRSPFIRTPKFNIQGIKDKWEANKYLSKKLETVTIIEGLLTLYFLSAIAYSFVVWEFGFLPFHLMLFVGYGLIFYFSVNHAFRMKTGK